MLLFAISFILVFTSTYLITSILEPRKNILGFFYFFVLAFAQVVLTFEILSLFTAIKEPFVLGINAIIFVASIILWNKKNRPLYQIPIKDTAKKIFNSFKLDKSLAVLFFGWLIFITSVIFLCITMPTTNGDAYCYHVNRSLFWALQHSLNHFETVDIRNLCLPINSEIIYTWIILFVKKDVFVGFPSFIGYIISMVGVYNIMGMLGFCTRKRLWVIFILSSLSSVIVQASGTETDIIIAGLVLTTIYLFWHALKTEEKTPIFMASLAYALAIGTKTTSLMMIPGVGLFMLALCFHYKKFTPLAKFIGFGLINFLVFSSYNYILNYIHFGNFMSSKNFIVVSANYYGLKGMFANFIKYIYMFFDFTGFRWSDYVGDNLDKARTATLTFFHLGHVKDGLYTTGYNFQRTLIEPMMGAGVIGFLVYLPCLLWSSTKPFISKFRYKKIVFLAGFTALFIINLLVMSYTIAYMAYSVRFVMALLVLSSPILVYSYFGRKNILKYIIIAFSLFYMIFVSNNLWARPMIKIAWHLKQHPSLLYIRRLATCKDFEKNPNYYYEGCIIKGRVKKNFKPNNRILALINSGDSTFDLKSLEYEGYTVDIRRLESFNPKDLKNYNLIVTTSKGQGSSYITQYAQRKGDYLIKGNKLIVNRKKEIPCKYDYNLEIPNGESVLPHNVICLINKDFTQKYNLTIVDVTGLIRPAAEQYTYFIILQNDNNPPHMKRKLKIFNAQ